MSNRKSITVGGRVYPTIKSMMLDKSVTDEELAALALVSKSTTECRRVWKHPSAGKRVFQVLRAHEWWAIRSVAYIHYKSFTSYEALVDTLRAIFTDPHSRTRRYILLNILGRVDEGMYQAVKVGNTEGMEQIITTQFLPELLATPFWAKLIGDHITDLILE